MSLENQTILITGASRGIGRAIALRLAREQPAHIVVGYNSNYQAARGVVEEVEALGVAASAIGVDVSKPELLREMFDKVAERLGRLDVFVSNAARTSFRPTMEITARTWQRIMDLNAQAFLLGSQMAAELMQQNGGGRIIGISSLGSSFYLPQYAGLGAAKATIESLARYLAVELAPHGIRVNVVSGGFIDTESMRRAPQYDELTAYVKNRTPLQRLGQPEDIAGAVALLCSPDADWICGQTLVADGGFSLVL
jgi:enoyl-[acyl-carrier protein] reductase III